MRSPPAYRPGPRYDRGERQRRRFRTATGAIAASAGGCPYPATNGGGRSTESSGNGPPKRTTCTRVNCPVGPCALRTSATSPSRRSRAGMHAHRLAAVHLRRAAVVADVELAVQAARRLVRDQDERPLRLVAVGFRAQPRGVPPDSRRVRIPQSSPTRSRCAPSAYAARGPADPAGSPRAGSSAEARRETRSSLPPRSDRRPGSRRLAECRCDGRVPRP